MTPLFIAKLFLIWLGLSMIATAFVCRLFYASSDRREDERPNRSE